MLITENNIELRNLQEQVLKNKEDIARHYEIDRTLANFGIKIVGTVSTVNDLPNPLNYEGQYGDGYAVGQPGNYTYYLFTRPDPNAGINQNHWLDVGQLAIQGPEGPEGPQGPQGETGQSTKWYTNQITADDRAKPGDLLLEGNGDVFQYNGELSQWVLITNIKGPQGVQGPRGIQGIQGPQGIQGEKGDTGDVGGFINIAGILTSAASLPNPAAIKDLTVAYLVGTTTPQDLYIQVGSTSDTAIWENMGPLNVATYVTVNGQYQNTWNSDTKLDKNTSVTQFDQLYTKEADGSEGYINVTQHLINNAVVQRLSSGAILVPTNPGSGNEAICQLYLESVLINKLELLEPPAKETDFVVIKKDNNGWHQENMVGTYTPKTSDKFVGVLRGMQGDIRGMVPANPHSYTLVNVEYLEQRLNQLKQEIISELQ